MKNAGLITLALLSGCAPHDEWTGAAERYQCTDAQMQKAAAETLFCKKEAGYTPSYCYSTAIMRNCDPKRPTKEAVDSSVLVPHYW